MQLIDRKSGWHSLEREITVRERVCSSAECGPTEGRKFGFGFGLGDYQSTAVEDWSGRTIAVWDEDFDADSEFGRPVIEEWREAYDERKREPTLTEGADFGEGDPAGVEGLD